MEEPAKKKRGRGRPRKTIETVAMNFRADPETVEAIDKIVASLPIWMGKGGGRSAAIRKAVLQVAARLPKVIEENFGENSNDRARHSGGSTQANGENASVD